jgi:hypothetical protein
MSGLCSSCYSLFFKHNYPKDKIKLDIDKSIELNPTSQYSKALRIIKELKEEFGDCDCYFPRKKSGIMSTRSYIGIQFTQCKKCKSYSFRQDQIYDFIEKITKDKELIKT